MKENGSKKFLILIIVLLLLATVGVLGWMIYSGKGGSLGESIKNVLPFGQGGGDRPQGVGTNTEGGGGGMINGGENQPVVVLRKLHNSPVAGIYSFIKQKTGTTTKDVIVRYIERGLGHIYETNMTTLSEGRISNETRPKIYEALWGGNGNNLAIRYLDGDDGETIQTYAITLSTIKSGTSTDGVTVSSSGIFLPENISEMAISRGKDDRVFYILPNGDSSAGIISGFDGKKKTQLFDSPLKEWLPFWPNDKLITLTTKPSQNVPGFMFFLDTQSGKTTNVLGGVNGLTTLTSPDGKNVLYSESVNGGLALSVYHTDTATSEKLSITTLPDKCVWSKLQKGVLYCGVPQNIPGAGYPDSWYQGVTSFTDDLWKINSGTGETILLASPSKLSGEDVDATKLSLSPDESFLFFVNKKDSAPWSLNLTVDSSQNS